MKRKQLLLVTTSLAIVMPAVVSAHGVSTNNDGSFVKHSPAQPNDSGRLLLAGGDGGDGGSGDGGSGDGGNGDGGNGDDGSTSDADSSAADPGSPSDMGTHGDTGNNGPPPNGSPGSSDPP